MKKLIIFALLFMLVLAACKKNDPVNYSELIVGKWNQALITIEYIPANNPKEEYIIPPGYIVEFAANAKVYVTDGQAAPVYDGEWAINDKTLNYGPNICNISQITSNKLVYTQETIYQDYKTISTYSFTRK